MAIIFKTHNIDQEKYKKLIRRTIILNGHDGTHLSGQRAWLNFQESWDLFIIPVTEQGAYRRYYRHLNVETSDGIAWGVTGHKVIYMFVNDKKSSFIIRQNMMPLAHELLHALYQDVVGTSHITRLYNAPEGRAGGRGAAASVIVHDLWYGSKKTLKMWIRWGIIWIPITIPYQNVKESKEIYQLI